ncbi:MAG: ABCB family ABC transporter ATP-binding protein/permease [Alphaproteobacteria bacterium]
MKELATPKDLKRPSDWRTLMTLMPYLWKEGMRFRVVLSGVLLILGKLTSILIPIFYKLAVDALSQPKELLVALPVLLLVGYGVTRLISVAFAEVKDAIFAKVAQGAIRHAGMCTFHHLHQLSLRFHLDRKTGGLTRAIERGVKAIERVLRFSMFNILPTIFEISFVSITLWILFDWTFVVVTVVTLAIYIWYTVAITQWRTKFVRKMNKVDNQANTMAIDSLLNYETVKYFCNERHEELRFDDSLRVYEGAAIKNSVSLSILNVGQGLIIALGLMIVMMMAGQGVVDGTMTIGDFVLVNTYLLQLALPLGFLGFAYREIKLALVDMEYMFELAEVDREITDKPDAKDLQIQRGAITFDSVNFSYNPERPILKGLSFEVPAGHTVAIVGASGAGKSTLSRLLFRFYDVSQGAITIDGQDIRDITQHSLRSAIGIVPQDTVLFNDTIAYNIAYGRPGASEEEILAAAKIARIHDFIENLPNGYESLVGERGLKLSGGEKQRVAIARTILKQPDIFLFDEATSALDTHTEKAIQQSLRDVSSNRTTLIIAHRLSTVTHANQILVMDSGEIVERGTHQELLAKKDIYAAMWARQLEEEKVA